MFKISRDFVKENCSSFSFDRGLEYHFGNRVRAIQYNPQKNVFTATVHDLKERNVSVTFGAEGQLIGTQCSCRLSDKTTHAFCEHIAAVLILIEQRDSEGFFGQLKDRERAKRIFDLFTFQDETDAAADGARLRSAIRLEPVYLLPGGAAGAGPGGGGGFGGVSGTGAGGVGATDGDWLFDGLFGSAPERNARFFFKLWAGGASYLIKNIARFAWALDKRRPLDFSKKFAYDPAIHTLEGFDALVADFLLELREAGREAFEDKYMRLSDRQFRRFLDFYANAGRRLLVEVGRNTYRETEVCDEGILIDFRLDRDDRDFVLKVGLENRMTPLTEDGDIVFYRDRIHRLPKGQTEVLRPLLDLLETYRDREFRFISEDRSRFVSEVLPAIDRIGTLSIDDEVTSLIDRKPLAAEIFLDQEDGVVTADVRFHYGETDINPFAAASKAENADGRIIVRDVKTENEILDIFAEADFKVKNTKINLYDDDSIYNFVVEILPRLQRHAEVYYSQEFKKMSVRRSIGFRANLSLSTGAGGVSGGLAELLSVDFDTDLIDRGELLEILRGIREKKRYYKLKDGSLLNLAEKETQDVVRLMDLLGAGEADVLSGHMLLPSYRALYLDYYLRSSEIKNVGRDRILRDFVRALNEPAESEESPPVSVGQVLRDYQKTGFRWLKALYAYSLGGVLADDMGLGKTLQVLVLLLSIKEEAEARAGAKAGSFENAAPSLIVAPTSLIYNWCAEIEKFTPNLSYLAVTGSKAERSRLIRGIPGRDVVITSYPLIRRDYEEYRDILFRCCILDEAQYIKNPNSQNAISVKCLRARSRFALTGTPMENRLLELWSIFDFVLPGYLNTAKAFSERYASVAESRGVAGAPEAADAMDAAEAEQERESGPEREHEPDHAPEQEHEPGSAQGRKDPAPLRSLPPSPDVTSALNELSGQIRPFLLRRLKVDVLRELPDKIDTRMYAQMTDEQKKLYLVYLEKIRREIAQEISENGFEKSQIMILAALTRLRQICCHPALFVEGYEDESGKLLLLQELVRDAIDGQHRILLFSQFTGMLTMIRKWAAAENISCHYIDGQVKPLDRHRMINEFNDGAGDLFLLSLKAGGTGVNLTGADTVIHYDPWWNPAVEDQATDRAYRIGQRKTVQVIKLLTAGSIEEKIFAIQERKKQLIDAVIKPGETFLTKLSRADLDEILSYDGGAGTS
ncbi:MAG: DEAD/DEAH box helicase [Clostridiales bacterium]|jgi:SNF2 family DNA or RNA helicase|nr:DEAD/DEAH box helicase [Clostridiales bacterium]